MSYSRAEYRQIIAEIAAFEKFIARTWGRMDTRNEHHY
jgi:hypothetical protein